MRTTLRPPEDHLDEAIDHVAKRMTHVEDDREMVARISRALPERPRGLTWILVGWAPRLAGLALGAAALAVVLTNVRTEVPTNVPTHVPTHVPTDVLANARPNDRPNVPDHEFSLPAIVALETMSIGALAPDSLPVEEPLVVAPLAIADLPATEPFSPR